MEIKIKNISILINRLSAKGTDGVMKPAIALFAHHFYLLYSPCRLLAYYRTRGGEWRGCIAATPHSYMVSAIC